MYARDLHCAERKISRTTGTNQDLLKDIMQPRCHGSTSNSMELTMLKSMLCGVAIAAFVIAAPLRAENVSRTSVSAMTTTDSGQLKNLQIPGTDYKIDFTLKTSSGVHHPSQSLIKAIKRWLSLNFYLRATYPDPIIELAAAETLGPLRYRGFLSDWPQDIVFPGQQPVAPSDEIISARDREKSIAVYDDEMKTIYLPENWTGNTPAQLSVLVHQMVHHLQGATPTGYECPQAREELAYTAQAKWLDLFGRNLETEFNIDPLTLVVSTRCIY
jgi:hypothetical protein